LKVYSGKYQISNERNLTVTMESNSLIAQAAGIRQRDLIPVSPSEFVWFSPESNVDMRIQFIKNESGKISYAVLRAEGTEVWRAERVE